MSNSGLQKKIMSRVVAGSSSEGSDEEFLAVPTIPSLSSLGSDVDFGIIPLTEIEAADNFDDMAQSDGDNEEGSSYNEVVVLSDDEEADEAAKVASCANRSTEVATTSDTFKRASKANYSLEQKKRLVVEKRRSTTA